MGGFIITEYLDIRQKTVALCEPLETEDFVVQPITDVSPIKWHLAHTTWFFETFLLAPLLKNYVLFHEKYSFLFNSYYNAVGERVSKEFRGIQSRPTTQDILNYRAYVDEHIMLLVENNRNPEIAKRLTIGLHHEQQHQELMMYDIKYIFFHNVLNPIYKVGLDRVNYQHRPDHYLSFKEGLVQIGNISEQNEFCFDNEYPKHRTYLNAFEISERLVNNGDFIEFVLSGGYRNAMLWLADGWDWVQVNGISQPLYWKEMDGEWFEWTFSGWEVLNPNKPVSHLNFYEAEAFARFAGKRLPTEFEWEHAANTYEGKGTFLNQNQLSPSSPSETPLFTGELWQWTNSAYLPYPGYAPQSGAYGEYNGKFMSGQMVLRGGSFLTEKTHFRITYRNFFQPDKRWLASGIRLAGDA